MCFSTITAMSRGLQRLAVEGRAAGQQRTDVGGEVGADVLPQVVDREILGAAAPERRPAHHPQPERVVARRTRQPVTLVMRVDVVDHDRRVAELGAAQHRLQPLDQRARRCAS